MMKFSRISAAVVLLGVCVPLALQPASAADADNGEGIFKRALNYTVQVRSTVPLPFDGDRKGSGLGAGFLVDPARGWIMTNAHVVSRSPSRVEIALYGEDFSEATKVYVDPLLDVAIIKAGAGVNMAGIVPAPLDCGGLPPVGHPVGAFGHPWRLQFTGTRGIISGVTAKYKTELLQTDAPINQGNSGGPLISLQDGRIVGINTAGIRGAQNTNFAVAMKYACRILALLQEGKDPSPPDFGAVYYRDLDNRRELRVARTYPRPGVLPLQPGDLIREVVGVAGRIENETQLLHALRGRLDDSALRIVRDGKEIVLNGHKAAMPRVVDATGIFASGVLFGPATMRDAPEINARGFMIHHVEQGSIGEAQEIEKNDLLESIDGSAITSMEDLHNRLIALCYNTRYYDGIFM